MSPGGTGGTGGSGGTGGPGGPGRAGSRTGSGRPALVVRRLPGLMLRRRALVQPDATPYRWAAGCSYAELDLRARAVAARLGTGLPPGDRVLLAYPRGSDLAGAFYGCLYAGMVAVPMVTGPGGRDQEGAVAAAVGHVRPAAVLTGADGWTALAVDRGRTKVMEADGERVGGVPLRVLAEAWAPVGVLRTAAAYQRYIADGMGGGRLEPALSHDDLGAVTTEIARAARLGTPEDSLGWVASVHGIEDAVWRILLPVLAGGPAAG